MRLQSSLAVAAAEQKPPPIQCRTGLFHWSDYFAVVNLCPSLLLATMVLVLVGGLFLACLLVCALSHLPADWMFAWIACLLDKLFVS
jgi:hypothetical protein